MWFVHTGLLKLNTLNFTMRYFSLIIIIAVTISIATSCRSTKAINKTLATKDSLILPPSNVTSKDSLLLNDNTKSALRNNYINFNTFSAKIKVDVQAKDNVPELTANLRMIKDSIIWISLQATFLNIEAYRVRITRDSVVLLNKLDKEVQYRTLDYLQDVTQIPFDFKTIQDILIGNPVFFSDSNALVRKKEEELLVYSVGNLFKNLLTMNSSNFQLVHSKLDDVDVNRNRTASISYNDYENINGKPFSTRRQIIITEKNRIEIKMNYKQVEFNKELSVSFSVPKNYKRK
ncbi:MAG: DUF4292 domain-containing protein [Sphingobacteriales bacterium]|nr:MAG: DUF4292 domain-containing protein [Sphingobacteriales bacterium]